MLRSQRLVGRLSTWKPCRPQWPQVWRNSCILFLRRGEGKKCTLGRIRGKQPAAIRDTSLSSEYFCYRLCGISHFVPTGQLGSFAWLRLKPRWSVKCVVSYRQVAGETHQEISCGILSQGRGGDADCSTSLRASRSRSVYDRRHGAAPTRRGSVSGLPRQPRSPVTVAEQVLASASNPTPCRGTTRPCCGAESATKVLA